MGKSNLKVRSNFLLYSELRSKRKTIFTSPIDISKPKERNLNFKLGETLGTHQTITDPIKFEVEVKVDNSKDFKFKLFCKKAFEMPFFRFDSSGPTHKNNDPRIPLKDQAVTTPHFHQFNDEGIELAYKTKALMSSKQVTLLEDIHNCIMHFCEEGNIRYKISAYPEVTLQKGELTFNFTNDDPLKNVNF